jgi:2-polyprenyl-6-methoxyphenol hydroxylase-like FAD-dependent oxidoreductase
MRRSAQLEVVDTGVPIDVLWFRISRRPSDVAQLLGRVNFGKALVLIGRGDYFQAGLIIRKGSFEQIQSEGLPSFRESLQKIAPFLGERVSELRDWEQVKLLTVQINHLRQWYRPGLLCIGDAAHAMSPAGGVGINVAIQDAIATARILAGALLHHRPTDKLLHRVQRRREWPARLVQIVQKQAHLGLARVFDNPGPLTAPWQLKIAVRIPGLRRATARLIGLGPRPEHIARSQDRRPLIALACIVGATLAILSRPKRQRNRAIPNTARMLD